MCVDIAVSVRDDVAVIGYSVGFAIKFKFLRFFLVNNI